MNLITQARDGDQQAIAALYEQTYSKVYYTIKSMVKDEDAVFDILQDSYIKAFSHLDNFEGDENFLPWIKQIAANTARDWMKKKRPLLFSELSTGEDTDTPIEELFEDERSINLPEEVIEQEETKRLLREIIEELPEDQRAVIGMYYYEELSVKEIALATGASENAVKSRLLYGRRKIEKKVRELEKKGTKLYGLAAIPFLLLLFKNLDTHAQEIPDSSILQNVLGARTKASTASGSSIASGNAMGAACGTSAGSAAASAVAGGFSAAKITVIAIVAAAVIGGGIFGGIKIHNAVASRKEVPTASESSAIEEEITTDEQIELIEEESSENADTLPTDGDRLVLTGTVNVISYDEAVELQGYPDYNASDTGQTWVIVRLDSPQLLHGTQDVDTWDREYSVLLISTRLSSGLEFGENTLADYTGKHIVFSAGSYSLASDTSVPIGVPWAHDIHILDVTD